MRHRPLLIAALTVAMAAPAMAQQQAPEHNLVLLGTAADDVGGGVAIVQRADGGMLFLERGQEVDGYTVLRIEPALAVLKGGEAEITLLVPGADPTGAPGSIGRIRTDFRNTLANVREAGWEARQVGGAVWYVDSAGRPQASVRIPEELLGEEFAPVANVPPVEFGPNDVRSMPPTGG